jgi:uncharacterized protein (TIGR02145 family)
MTSLINILIYKQMKKIFFLMLSFLIGSAASMNAQVRIGGLEDPHQSAVLDLNEDDEANEGNLGFALPRVFLREKNQKLNNAKPADGTVIYNTNSDYARGRGIYFWTDSLWIRAASCTLREGDTITILRKPIIMVLSEPAEGLGATFGINTAAPNDNGSIYRYEWTITPDPADGYKGVPTSVNSKMQEITVPYDNVERRYTAVARAIADGYNDPEASDPVKTSVPGKFQPSYDILGENYYDIAVTEYDLDAPNYPYGIKAYRTPFALKAGPDSTYTYKIVGRGGGSPEFAWSVESGAEFLVGGSTLETIGDSICNIQFKPEVLTHPSIVDKPEANLTVQLKCHVRDGSFEEDYIKTIEIGDRDVCIPAVGLTDAEGNEYSVYRFGNSGCWMTQNLRSTKTLQNGIEVFILKDKNTGNSNTLASWYYPNGDDGGASLFGEHPEYGLLYTWPAANIGTVATESADAFKISSSEGKNSDRQGICPAGWVVPSDWDWSMLEKEIATNPSRYSDQTNPYANAGTYDFYTGYVEWRPGMGADQTWWGRQMKSPTQVTTTNPSGSSKTDGYGFNALLVGGLVTGEGDRYGTFAFFLSGSSGSSTIAWRRNVSNAYSSMYRNTVTKACMYSVRCKKLE